MGNTPITSISATGIYKPPFQDCLSYYQGGFQAIYGQDIYIANDSQDGQFVGLLALALDDCNGQAVAAYNSFSPITAQGTGLSSNVKLNGIARKIPSNSTVDLIVGGVWGTVIDGGVVSDGQNDWLLPPEVIIPVSGQITVTATAALPGAILAPAGTVTIINTITLGWQTVTNPAPANPGQPVELDGQLRARQAVSTSLPAQSNLESVKGAVLAISGVTSCEAYENDDMLPDANTLPGHCIALVVEGGDDTAIAEMIALKKAPGCGTYGTTAVVLNDEQGVPHAYRFFRPSIINISYNVAIKPLPGFTQDIHDAIITSIVDWTNALPPGKSIALPLTYLPVQLYGGAGSNTYELQSVLMARDGTTPVAADIAILFNEQAYCEPDFVQIIVPLPQPLRAR
jgi:uncharacterized phage protein gp47/JayE